MSDKSPFLTPEEAREIIRKVVRSEADLTSEYQEIGYLYLCTLCGIPPADDERSH